ncbi:ABC transporter permease [Psychrobacter sp. FDAARGOS_221]|uniref:ABC transporter permease n=1 Tax=Psychrobacter sp. FDAARGOS_221 TaxID=1975705 RepID=UPI000BB52F01|nr:ABC transporter permease [Psychrobacter sp. FDAARGOS_221]PNK60105.1 ABC transporter permease [Psychrobacter sp. FDAARGOS_221]
MSQSQGSHNPTSSRQKPSIVFGDKDNRQSSLISVFLRSARYEGRFLLHNSWDYVMLLWLPLLTILGTWWIFSKPYIVDVPIGVIDDSKSSYSRTLTRFLDTSPDLKVEQIFQNSADAQAAILDQQVYAVVIIPHDFSEQLNKGKPAPVVLKVNAQYGTHSGIVQKGVQTVVGTLSAGAEMKRLVKQGAHSEQAKVSYSPIGIERISLFNIGANYQQFLASTVIPALLHILAMVIGATTIGREIRDKTFSIWYHTMIYPDMPYPDFKTLKHVPPEQKLAALHANLHPSWQMPVDYQSLKQQTYRKDNQLTTTAFSLKDANYRYRLNLNKSAKPRMPTKVSILALVVGLNGKLIWALLFYMLWGGLMVMLAVTVHPASLTAMLMVFVAFVALMMVSLWLGAIFTLTSYSLRMGLSSTGFVSAPSFAFAGVTFPLMAMSEGAQRWANALPLTHYLKVHLSQLQMLAPTSVALPTLIGLIIAVAVTLVIAALLCLRAFKNPQRWGAR